MIGQGPTLRMLCEGDENGTPSSCGGAPMFVRPCVVVSMETAAERRAAAMMDH